MQLWLERPTDAKDRVSVLDHVIAATSGRSSMPSHRPSSIWMTATTY